MTWNVLKNRFGSSSVESTPWLVFLRLMYGRLRLGELQLVAIDRCQLNHTVALRLCPPQGPLCRSFISKPPVTCIRLKHKQKNYSKSLRLKKKMQQRLMLYYFCDMYLGTQQKATESWSLYRFLFLKLSPEGSQSLASHKCKIDVSRTCETENVCPPDCYQRSMTSGETEKMTKQHDLLSVLNLGRENLFCPHTQQL